MNTSNNLYKNSGIIINIIDYKEYDKLLTVLTKDLGKIQVYAFNVRKQNSKNLGNLSLFNFLEFDLRKNNDSYTLESTKLIKSFIELSSNYEKLCYASYFAEFVSYFTLENMDTERICKLLYYTYLALINNKMSNKLIRRVFELKMMKIEGIYKSSDSLYNKSDTLKYTWDYILKTETEKLFSFTLNDELFSIFNDEISIEIKQKINYKFKTLKNIC